MNATILNVAVMSALLVLGMPMLADAAIPYVCWILVIIDWIMGR